MPALPVCETHIGVPYRFHFFSLSVRVTSRTSMTCLPGICNARKVSGPRPFSKRIIPTFSQYGFCQSCRDLGLLFRNVRRLPGISNHVKQRPAVVEAVLLRADTDLAVLMGKNHPVRPVARRA